jgi:hypothetical protein
VPQAHTGSGKRSSIRTCCYGYCRPPNLTIVRRTRMPDYFLICSVPGLTLRRQEPKISIRLGPACLRSSNTVHCLVSSVACNSNLMHSSLQLASSISCSPWKSGKIQKNWRFPQVLPAVLEWKTRQHSNLYPYASCWGLSLQDEADTFELDGPTCTKSSLLLLGSRFRDDGDTGHQVCYAR